MHSSCGRGWFTSAEIRPWTRGFVIQWGHYPGSSWAAMCWRDGCFLGSGVRRDLRVPSVWLWGTPHPPSYGGGMGRADQGSWRGPLLVLLFVYLLPRWLPGLGKDLPAHTGLKTSPVWRAWALDGPLPVGDLPRPGWDHGVMSETNTT